MTEDEELAAIRAEKAQLEYVINSSIQPKYASDDEELESIRAEKAQLESQLSDNSLSPYHEIRGIAKTVGAAADVGRKTFPTTDSVKKSTLEMAIKSIEGSPGREEELQSLKQDLANLSQNSDYSRQDKFVKNVDEFAGEDLGKTGTIGQFRQKLGEFLPGPIAGMKAAPAIAAVSQGLRELGLDESYSDLIAAIGTPNLKALAQLPAKALRKLGDYAATIGSKEYRTGANVEKAAEFLQNKVGQENIPEVVKNIENYRTPFKGNINEGEAAFRAPTADIADNVGLSQYHRAKAENIPKMGEMRQTNEQVMQREIDKLASKNATPQAAQEFASSERNNYKTQIDLDNIEAGQRVDRAADRFATKSNAEDAGWETQAYLEHHTTGIKDNAKEQTKPLYNAAKNTTLEGKPQRAFDNINDQMKKYSRQDDGYRDAFKAKVAIEHSAGNLAEEQKNLIAAAKKRYKDDPSMLSIALKEIENAPHGTYTGEKLNNARKELKKIYQKIPPHETERRADFNRIMKEFDRDMESIPEIAAANNRYREIMEPFNVLSENPVLGNLFERGQGYTRQFTVTPAEIPKRVTSGSRSIEAANALISEAAGLGSAEHTQMIDSLKSYINSDILSTFVETNGKVNPAKFESWAKSNPGAFILYPELKTKLKNLENAQSYVNRTIKQNEELLSKFYEKSMTAILGDKFKGVNPDRIAGRILDSSNSESVMEDAVNLLYQDKSGNGLEGLKRGMINHLKEKFKSDKFTFATLNDYLTKNKKSLGKLFDQDQIEVLEKSKDWLKKQAVMERVGKGTNSDSIPKLMENLAEKNGGKATEGLFGISAPGWMKSITGWAKDLTDLGKLKYLEKALLEPKMAKFLLTKDIKTNKNFFDSLENKEDFAKWMRDSEPLWDTIKGSAEDIGKNFSITSQAVLKAKLNDN